MHIQFHRAISPESPNTTLEVQSDLLAVLLQDFFGMRFCFAGSIGILQSAIISTFPTILLTPCIRQEPGVHG